MNAESAEAAVLERLVPDLRSQGYDVFIHPNKQMVPAFLEGYLPDVIALRNDKNLVFEIKTKNDRVEAVIQNLTKRFEGQSRWEFRVVWANPNDDRDEPTIQSAERISARLGEISKLLNEGFPDSAMLMCWATFEAIGRKMMASEMSRPQTPGRLVQVLAMEGHITPDDADFLRQMASKRNQLIHGNLETKMDRSEVETFLQILQSLSRPVLPDLFEKQP